MENIHGTKITSSVIEEVVLEEGCHQPFTKITRYTLDNGVTQVDVIDYGATITAVRVPDRDGNIADVVLGFQEVKGYMSLNNNPYFGATIGRVTNRIARGKFSLDGVQYNTSINSGEHSLHGGIIGFNKRLWKGSVDKEGVVMTLVSAHLDQGYPGELTVEAKFVLLPCNTLLVTYRATTDRATIVNMTNHTYFNLAGHDAGAEKMYEHNLMLRAINFTPTDEDLIPKGKIQDVIDCCLDFTISQNLGEAIEATGTADGFDINFVLNSECFGLDAILEHPGTGRMVVISSNQPGLQLYTANCLQVKEGRGKGGVGYGKHAAVCLETQNFPNAINVKHFPSCVLRPQGEYLHIISYEFSTFPVPQPLPPIVFSSQSITDDGHSEAGATPPASDQEQVEEAKPSERCARENLPTDPPPCTLASVYPDFSAGHRFCEGSVTSIDIDTSNDCPTEFYSMLRTCTTLYSEEKRQETPIRRRRRKQSVLNIVTDTDLTPTRHFY